MEKPPDAHPALLPVFTVLCCLFTVLANVQGSMLYAIGAVAFGIVALMHAVPVLRAAWRKTKKESQR